VTRITVNLHENQYIFVTISRSVLLRVRNVSVKIVEKTRNTNFAFLDNRAFCGLMWKKYCRVGQATDENMMHTHCMLDT
jgi:hypothetical protein